MLAPVSLFPARSPEAPVFGEIARNQFAKRKRPPRTAAAPGKTHPCVFGETARNQFAERKQSPGLIPRLTGSGPAVVSLSGFCSRCCVTPGEARQAEILGNQNHHARKPPLGPAMVCSYPVSQFHSHGVLRSNQTFLDLFPLCSSHLFLIRNWL